MSILYPGFLWLLIPLSLLFWTRAKKMVETGHLIILMLLVIAMSRPAIKQGIEESPIEAKEFIIALDISYSMKAKDIQPNRYLFAKETVKDFLAMNPTDNIMLIAFTSNPLLLSPPTTDHQLISIALESLNPKYILTKGTSLEKLFKKVASMQSKQKNLILITDGGEEENIGELSSIIQNAEISLTILALGSRQGATIEKSDGSLLKDKEQHLIISRINPLLETLASETGGTYLTASSTPESTAKALYSILDLDTQKVEFITKKQHRYSELYQIPLLFALLLFLMLHTRAVKFLVLAFTLLGISAEAAFLDNYYLDKAYQSYQTREFNTTKEYLSKLGTPSLQSRFTLANTYYNQGDYKKALKTYLSIRSTSTRIKQKLYYNIANCYVKQESYDKAKIYYAKTLQLGEDIDAKANLALIALLREKQSAQLGIAHPKSQSSDSSKKQQQEGKEEKEARNEDEPSSGSGDGGEKSNTKEQEKGKLTLDPQQEKYPLSSKVYELINKGYIHEKQPW